MASVYTVLYRTVHFGDVSTCTRAGRCQQLCRKNSLDHQRMDGHVVEVSSGMAVLVLVRVVVIFLLRQPDLDVHARRLVLRVFGGAALVVELLLVDRVCAHGDRLAACSRVARTVREQLSHRLRAFSEAVPGVQLVVRPEAQRLPSVPIYCSYEFIQLSTCGQVVQEALMIKATRACTVISTSFRIC